MSNSRYAVSVCAEIQRLLRSQSLHSLVSVPVVALSAWAPPRSAADAARLAGHLAVTFSSYLNNWAALADGNTVESFTRAISVLPAHSRLVLLLQTLKQCVTIDGSTVALQLISLALKPPALDDAFRALTAATDDLRASAEELFRLVCHAPSAAAAVLKHQTPPWFDAGVFVPAFITAALMKLGTATPLLLELVISQSCVQGYMRHALAALEAIIDAGSDVEQHMNAAVAAMKLPVLLRVIDHSVHCYHYRRSHRMVLAAVLSLSPSHAAISYICTDVWRQRSLTHPAACALARTLLSLNSDFSSAPLSTVLHCVSDMVARETFANSAHESHHFAVCAALRCLLMVPGSSAPSSAAMPLIFNGISNHLKCMVDSTRRHGMWVAEAVAPLLAVEGSEPLELLSAEERAQLQKLLDTDGGHEEVAVLFHMVRDDAPAPCSAQTRINARDGACSVLDHEISRAAVGEAIGVSIADDGWCSDGSAAGASDSDEDEVLSYDLPPEVKDKTWRSLEEGADLLLHEDANKVEQALRVAAHSIRCSRQMVPEFSDRLWRALKHARAKFDEDELSVCALSAMSQVTCLRLCDCALVVTVHADN